MTKCLDLIFFKTNTYRILFLKTEYVIILTRSFQTLAYSVCNIIHVYLFVHVCIQYVLDDIFVYTVGRSLVFLMSLEYAPAHIRYYIDLLHVGFYNVTFV